MPRTSSGRGEILVAFIVCVVPRTSSGRGEVAVAFVIAVLVLVVRIVPRGSRGGEILVVVVRRGARGWSRGVVVAVAVRDCPSAAVLADAEVLSRAILSRCSLAAVLADHHGGLLLAQARRLGLLAAVLPVVHVFVVDADPRGEFLRLGRRAVGRGGGGGFVLLALALLLLARGRDVDVAAAGEVPLEVLRLGRHGEEEEEDDAARR